MQGNCFPKNPNNHPPHQLDLSNPCHPHPHSDLTVNFFSLSDGRIWHITWEWTLHQFSSSQPLTSLLVSFIIRFDIGIWSDCQVRDAENRETVTLPPQQPILVSSKSSNFFFHWILFNLNTILFRQWSGTRGKRERSRRSERKGRKGARRGRRRRTRTWHQIAPLSPSLKSLSWTM